MNKEETNFYDLVIIGGGPAGLSTGIYAARSTLKTLIIEEKTIGGLITLTHSVENYPGGIFGESGVELTQRMKNQAEELGVTFASFGVTHIDMEGIEKKVHCGNGVEYIAKAIVIATGASPNPLGCKGEETHIGMGVSYCATCDANFFRELETIVVGGGDSALEEALYLTRFARKVTLIHRRDEFRGAKSIQDAVKNNPKIHILYSSTLEEIKGDGPVDSVMIKNLKTNEIYEYRPEPDDGMMGVFIFVGNKPNTDIFKDQIVLTKQGYIVADEAMKTNVKGVFVAGDVRVKELRQVSTAVADGAIAGVEVGKYLEGISNL